MIGDAVFRIIESAHFLRPVTGADLTFTGFGAFIVRFVALFFIELDLELLHRLVAVHMLGFFRRLGDDARRNMGDPHSRIGFVDVLAAGSGGAIGINPDVLCADLDLDVLWGRQNSHCGGRCVDAALGFGCWHALDTVHAAFPFHPAKRAIPFNIDDQLLIAADIAFCDRHNIDFPALKLGIALVHTEQVTGKQRRLVSARASADFKHDVGIVIGILGKQQKLHFGFEIRQLLAQLISFFARKLGHLGIIASHHCLGFDHAGADRFKLIGLGGHGLELGMLFA